MKASTMFAVTIAVLLGLSVVAVAKYTGIFNPRAAAPMMPPERPKILVAASNLFEGMVIQHNEVHVRNMTAEEEEFFKDKKSQLLPANPAAGALRVLLRNIEADQPILREYLQDNGLPDALNVRLSPNMRAVNVELLPQHAVGGMIQTGETVDVYLTTKISMGHKGSRTVTETARIARNLLVLAKRNMLWNAMIGVSPHKPIDYTLETNPYRAGLIEYCKSKGALTLVPTAKPKTRLGKSRSNIVPQSQSDSTSREFADEDRRIADFLSGEKIVGEADLVRIFNLKPFENMYVKIEKYNGVTYRGMQTFGYNGDGRMHPITDEPSYGYQFVPVHPTGHHAGEGHEGMGG